MELRKAVSADAWSIRALIYRVGINPTALNWQRFLVAVDENNRVIGCGQIKPHADGTRELASIAVQPEWQGRGIGKAIVTRLLKEAKYPLYLTCAERQEPFYLPFGFRPVAEADMPPYFRRIYQAYSILHKLFPGVGHLRIMVKTSS